MGDILKEAIADAKAVRETALENAKMALEEAFTPQIKSMLSAKLKEEEGEDEEVEEGAHDDEEAEEGAHDDEEAEEGMREDDEEPEAEEGEHRDEEAEEGRHEEGEDDEDVEENEDEDEVEEENLDLEAVIAELEAELAEGEDDEAEEGEEVEESTEAVEEGEEIEEEYEIDEAALTEEDDDEDKDEVDEELDKSSGIGKGDNKTDNTDTSSAIGGGKKGMKESALEAELKEYKEAVHFLKDKLHEVNILNAKLLFTNKLFKQYSLDSNQKLKVVETFDRAQTTREIKLVFSTLAEQFQDNGSIVTKKSISESASAPVASTKPSPEAKKVISEETQVAIRFKKLAGLIK